MFLQSQAYFGADSGIHALLMRHLDRAAVEVHAAVTTQRMLDRRVDALDRMSEIPGVRIRPTEFGPSMFGVTGLEKMRRLMAAPRLPLGLLELGAYVRRNRIRVLHGTEKPRDAMGAVLLGRSTGAKSVVHMHIAYGDYLSRSAKWALRTADGVIAISEFVAGTLVDAGYPRERIFVVHNALDVASSRWDSRIDGGPVRRELGIPNDAPVVGIWSRLFKWKGHEHLIDAVGRVREALPAVRLVIVGEDDHGAGGSGFRSQLEARVRALGLESNVVFTGFRTDIPQVVAAFDVCAVPSWEEPFGVVFLEAMAMRKPVVAWNSGGAPEIVTHEGTGLLVLRGSVQRLAVALERLLRSTDLRARLGEAGHHRALEVFSPQRIADGVLDVYERLTCQ